MNQARQELLFIEHAGDLANLKFYLKNQSLDPKHLLIVNFDAELDDDFPSGLKVKREEDYLGNDTYGGLNEEADSLTQALGREKILQEDFIREGVNLLEVEMKDLSRYFVWVLKRIKFVRWLLNQEPFSRIHLFSFPEDFKLEEILPNRFEKITNGVIQELKNQSPAEIKIWPDISGVSSRPREKKKKSTPFFWNLWLCDLARRFLNLRLARHQENQNALLFFGNPALLFPVLDEALKASGPRVLYYQDQVAPRMVFRLAGKKVGYYVYRDFLKLLNHRACPAPSQAHHEIQAVDLPPSLLKLFVFEGVDYSRHVLRRLKFLLKEKSGELTLKVRAWKAGLKRAGVQGIVIDQDITEHNKLFILTARALGIPTVEILHGIPAYVEATPLSCDKKLVWGNFVKERFAQYGLIEPEKMVVTGNPKFDALTKINRKKSRKEIQRKFGIKEGKKIVLLTTQPYKSGNRIGLVHVHTTRYEKERNLRLILRALKDKPVHLILKLHPNETKINFEKEMVEKEGYHGSLAVVQKYNIYTLLAACDLLITTWSNTILEALLLKTPVVMINFTGRKDIHPYAEWGAVRGVYQPELLGREVDQALAEGVEGVDSPGREKVLREFAYKIDGRSARRAYREIQKLFQEKSLELAEAVS